MKETIDKHDLVYDKSTYGLKLIRVSYNTFYVDITQTIHISEEVSSIKINPTALPDIIEILKDYKQFLDESPINHSKYSSEAVQQIIQDRYLKGVSIKDIALQTGKEEKLIETILRNRDIEIVSNELPDEYKVYNIRKKRINKRKR